MIDVINLTKKFGKITALNGISFTVKKGEIVGFLGPNGAGKTTTMRIITGYLSATEGKVLVNDLDVFEEPERVKRLIGYLPEDNPLYLELKVYEYLTFLAKIRGVEDIKDKIKKVVFSCSLEDVIARKIEELSKGFRQRVGLASCLLHEPEILILDEPTSGLDPNQTIEIRNLIKKIGEDKTVILSSHILSEVQATCNRAIIINEGRIIAQGTVKELTQRTKGKNILEIKIKAKEKKENIEKIIMQIKGVLDIKLKTEDGIINLEVETEGNTDIREAVFIACVKNNWILLEQTPKFLTLEEIFQKLTVKN